MTVSLSWLALGEEAGWFTKGIQEGVLRLPTWRLKCLSQNGMLMVNQNLLSLSVPSPSVPVGLGWGFRPPR